MAVAAAVAGVVVTLPRSSRVPMRLCGLTDFAPTGSADYLMQHFGLTPAAVASAAREALADTWGRPCADRDEGRPDATGRGGGVERDDGPSPLWG